MNNTKWHVPPEEVPAEERWEDEGGPVRREVLPAAVEGTFTREEIQDALAKVRDA